MKKIFYSSLIAFFVSTLFIGCPPRVTNPPLPPTDSIPDNPNYNDSIPPSPQDSLYDYVSEEYLRSIFPFELGEKFVYVKETDSVVDSLILTLTYNDIHRAFQLLIDVVAHNDSSYNKLTTIDDTIVDCRNKIGGFDDDDDDIYDDDYYYSDDYILSNTLENVNVKYKLEGENIAFTFELDFYTTVTKENSYAAMNMVYNFWTRGTQTINSVYNNCDCLCKDCLLNSCLTNTISLYNIDNILFVEIEHGKGITLFRDDEGNYWHLVE